MLWIARSSQRVGLHFLIISVWPPSLARWLARHRHRNRNCAVRPISRRFAPDIALIPGSPADTVPRACRPLKALESNDGRHTPAHAPGTLVPGIDPDAAALLGGLW